MSLWLRLSSCKSFEESGINTTSILHPLIDYNGTRLETLATHPAGKARTMLLTCRGRPGKIETPSWAGLFRLQKKPLALFPIDSPTANREKQLMRHYRV